MKTMSTMRTKRGAVSNKVVTNYEMRVKEVSDILNLPYKQVDDILFFYDLDEFYVDYDDPTDRLVEYVKDKLNNLVG